MATTKATSSYLNQAPRTLAEVEAEMGLRPRTDAERAKASIRAAGARGDARAFELVYRERHISLEEANAAWQAGERDAKGNR